MKDHPKSFICRRVLVSHLYLKDPPNSLKKRTIITPLLEGQSWFLEGLFSLFYLKLGLFLFLYLKDYSHSFKGISSLLYLKDYPNSFTQRRWLSSLLYLKDCLHSFTWMTFLTPLLKGLPSPLYLKRTICTPLLEGLSYLLYFEQYLSFFTWRTITPLLKGLSSLLYLKKRAITP